MNIALRRGEIDVPISIFLLAFWFGIIIIRKGADAYSWERPGCHRIGHTRTIRIAGCIQFNLTSNACRGYCQSFSIPSAEESLLVNPNQWITSVGQCCNMNETTDMTVRVMCKDGPRSFLFKSAESCSCYHCKKD
ncbi:glycoprotein hormone alpha 2 [Brevipalpus obovatus]|uniref:glycoprotein hormone alpha 2 n=1 Tax=Brevipalpus obovatus TaxID=246614 RepID=UPI003D9E7953